MKPTKPSDQEVAASISREITTIHEESYGEPVRECETTLFGDSVICLLEIDLLPHEHTLLNGGAAAVEDSILRTRKSYQQAIGPTFIATIERATGRKVTAFLSETHLDPPFSLEYFRLDGSTPTAT